MGRRSAHTPEELRGLILQAAQEIIEKDGLSGLSARAIARQIEYSPGTLYNMFENLDDLVLHVEARVLTELDKALGSVPRDGTPLEQTQRLADTYIRFTRERPRLWNLLFEHHLPTDSEIPGWYQDKLDSLLGHVETAIAPLFKPEQQTQRKRAARVLWAGVHGITSLATSDKLSSITTDSAQVLVRELITAYVGGVAQGALVDA
jgi:AcrR family transcriptional regulator